MLGLNVLKLNAMERKIDLVVVAVGFVEKHLHFDSLRMEY